jgi:hypothetical protein
MKRRMAYVDGVEKGEVYRDKHGHLCWHRGHQTKSVSTEKYPRGVTLDGVKRHISSLCRSDNVELKIIKE